MQGTSQSPFITTGSAKESLKRKLENNDQTDMLGAKRFDDGSQKTQDLAQQSLVTMQQMMGIMTELSHKVEKLDKKLNGIEPKVQQMYRWFLEQNEEATPIIETSTPDISEEEELANPVRQLFSGLFFPERECKLLSNDEEFEIKLKKELSRIEQQAAKQQENEKFATELNSCREEGFVTNDVTVKATGLGSSPAFATLKSPKHANQDCYTWFSMEVNYRKKMCPADFYIILDGHGPTKEKNSASIYCKNHIQGALKKCMSLLNTEGADYTIANALKMTFVLLDSMFKNYMEWNSPKEKRPGTTACLVMILEGLEDVIFVVNCGDSRAIFSSGITEKSMQLSYDFKSSDPYAQKTTKNRGGKIIFSYGSDRVDGSLGVVRAIGDEYLRDPVTQEKHISPRPKVVKVKLREIIEKPESANLLLATDGFFDVVSTGQAADAACELLKKNNTPDLIASIFSQAARKAGSQDDITVGVIPLQKYLR